MRSLIRVLVADTDNVPAGLGLIPLPAYRFRSR